MNKGIIESALAHYTQSDFERMNRLPMFSYASNQVLPAVIFKLPLGANGIWVVRAAEDSHVRHAKIIENFANELGLRAASLEGLIVSKTKLRIASSNHIQIFNYNKSGNLMLNHQDTASFSAVLNAQLSRISQVALRWEVLGAMDG